MEFPNLHIEEKLNKVRKDSPTTDLNGWTVNGNSYVEVCRLATRHDSIWSIFKRTKDMRTVIETATRKQGRKYLELIYKIIDNPITLSRCRTSGLDNDSVGDPITHRYSAGRFSPTTLRYIMVALELKRMFGPLDNFDILEIGGVWWTM